MSTPKKNQSLKCSLQVRNIPLERYRLSTDGRKWKQAARGRSGLLLRLSSYANGDGTFVRNGRNYSPSLKTLLNHVAHGSYYRLVDDLRSAGLLSWTREKHYERRIYTIHIPESGPKSDPEQIPDSGTTGPTFDDDREDQVPHSQDQVPHSSEQVPHSQKTGPISDKHPSLPSVPSKEPVKGIEPSSASNAANTKPTPFLPLVVSPAASLEGKGGGQGKTISQADVAKVMAAVYKTCGKTPLENRVREFLALYTADQIEIGFNVYYEKMECGSSSEKHAERMFFSERGGLGAIPEGLRECWMTDLENFLAGGASIDDESITSLEHFLQLCPPPAMENIDVILRNARREIKKRQRDKQTGVTA